MAYSPNQMQLDCISADEAATIISASPGSGKTSTLVRMIASDIERLGTEIDDIIGVTFTRLAASEMRRRLEGIGYPVLVTTFHGMCMHLLSRFWREGDFDRPEIVVYDEIDQKELLKECARHRRRAPSMARIEAALARYCAMEAVEDADAHDVVDMYIAELRRHNAVDYATTIRRARDVLHKLSLRPWVRIYVDECQDLDPLQHELLWLMRPARLVMVGDPNQTIYSWRGADPDYLDITADKFDAVRRSLRVNYRSCRAIVHVANRFQHRPAPMQAASNLVGSITLLRDEARVLKALQVHVVEECATAAVLARTNRELLMYAETARFLRIPTQMGSERERLLERESIRTLLAFMLFPEAPHSPLVLRRVAGLCGLSEITFETIIASARKSGASLYECFVTGGWISGPALEFYQHPESSILIRLAEAINTIERLPIVSLPPEFDLRELRAMIAAYVESTPFRHRSIRGLAAWLNLRDGQQCVQMDPARIQLLTIHGSKGLEFDAVAVAGLKRGRLPHRRQGEEPSVEEQRLMYVAVTRAREFLYLVGPPDPADDSEYLDVIWGPQ